MNRDIKRTLCFYFIVAIFVIAFACLFIKPSASHPNETLIAKKEYTEIGTSTLVNSLLLKNITYYGTELTTSGTSYSIIDNMNMDTKLYYDQNYKFASLPYKYTNAELISLPNSDGSIISNDPILTFSVKKTVDVYVLKDNVITNLPSWMSDYTLLTNETISGTNNVTYNVYKKTIVPTDNPIVVNIGANVDNINDLNNGVNQIVFVKEKDKVDNSVFFSYDFDGMTNDDLLNGFGAYIPTNTTLEVASVTDINNIAKNSLLFTDSTTSAMTYIRKHFAPLSGDFSVEFSAYVTYDPIADANTTKNTWLRFFLYDALEATSFNISDTDRSKLLLESYLYRVGDKLTFRINDSSNSAQVLASNISLNEWHTYRMEIKSTTRSFALYVDGVLGDGVNNNSSVDLYRQKSISKANFIVFGSGKSHISEYAIDDLKIKPKMDIGATQLIVGENPVDLYEGVTNYIAMSEKTAQEEVYSLVKTDDYFSHTVTVVSSDTIRVSVTNNNREVYTFSVLLKKSSILEGIDIQGDFNGVNEEIFDNEDTLHFVDTSTTNLSYIEKTLPNPISTALSLSFDIYLTDTAVNNVNDNMIKSFVTNGLMGLNYDDLSNAGVVSYLNPIGNTSDIGLKLVSNSILDDTNAISKETWHNLRYEIDVVEQKYKIYLDNLLIYEDYDFYLSQEQLNNIVIGTDYAGTADFYIKDFEIEEMSGAPLESITIDGYLLPSFDKNLSSNNYYTDQLLMENTEVLVVSNAYYTSHTVINNVPNQMIIINVVDNKGDTITYTVAYKSPIEQNISRAQLEELYMTALNLSLDTSSYTSYSWEKVAEAMTISYNTLYVDEYAVETDYAYAYYLLEKSIRGLLEYVSYSDASVLDIVEGYYTGNTLTRFGSVCYDTRTDTVVRETTIYQTSLVSTMSYSSNLTDTFEFEKVLENGEKIYKNEETIFTSVPYKYWNAEFIRINNSILSGASFKFTSNQNIHLVVFKDWNSSPLIENLVINNTTYSLYDTNEIAVASDGTIYRVYQTSNAIPSDSIFEINVDDFVNNKLTNKNGIVAFIKSTNANNTNFFSEDMDDYDNTLDFNKSWDSVIACNRDDFRRDTVNSVNDIVASSNSDNYLKQYSYDGKEMPIIFKRFAELYEKVEFKYTMYVDNNNNGTILTADQNKWLRTWLVRFEKDVSAGRSISTSAPDKTRVLVELYAGHGNMIYNYKQGTKNVNLGIPTAINTWYDYVVTLDIKNQTFNINVFPQGSSTSLCQSGDCTPTNNFFFNTTNIVDSTNYAYFAGRGTNASLARIQEVSVKPLASMIYDDLLINNNSIGTDLYQDLTKAYLYKYKETDTDIVLSTVSSLETQPNETIAYYPNNMTGTDKTSAKVTSNDSVNDINREYDIYFSLDENNKNIELANKLKEVEQYNKVLYTDLTYMALEQAIVNANASFSNHKISESEVQSHIDALTLAVNNLESRVASLASYSGKIVSDYHYNTFTPEAVNITNNSAFTANYEISIRAEEEGYAFAGKDHNRYLVSNVAYTPNTKIMMIDRTNSTPEYYYYIVTTNDYNTNKKRYFLNDFIRLGTINDHYVGDYYYNEQTREVSGNYFFIVDFVDCTQFLPTGTYLLNMELIIDEELVAPSDVLRYHLYDLRNNIELSAIFNTEYFSPKLDSSMNIEAEVDPIIVDGIPVIDTSLNNMTTSLKLTLYDASAINTIPFNKGVTIIDEDIEYSLDNDGVLRVTTLDSLESFSRSVVLKSIMKDFSIGEYKIKIDLIGEYRRIDDESIVASYLTDFIVREAPSCSIEAITQDSIPLIKPNIDPNLSFAIRGICNNVTDDRDITITLLKKMNNAFNDYAYEEVDLYSVLDNVYLYSTYKDLENTYLFNHSPYNNQTRTDDTYTFTSRIKTTALKGTYKMVVDIRAGDIIVSDSYSFYVS